MRVVCAWCGREFAEKGEGSEGEEVTHRICAPCIVLHFPEEAVVMGLVADEEMDRECEEMKDRALVALVVMLLIVLGVLLVFKPWDW